MEPAWLRRVDLHLIRRRQAAPTPTTSFQAASRREDADRRYWLDGGCGVWRAPGVRLRWRASCRRWPNQRTSSLCISNRRRREFAGETSLPGRQPASPSMLPDLRGRRGCAFRATAASACVLVQLQGRSRAPYATAEPLALWRRRRAFMARGCDMLLSVGPNLSPAAADRHHVSVIWDGAPASWSAAPAWNTPLHPSSPGCRRGPCCAPTRAAAPSRWRWPRRADEQEIRAARQTASTIVGSAGHGLHLRAAREIAAERGRPGCDWSRIRDHGAARARMIRAAPAVDPGWLAQHAVSRGAGRALPATR